MSKAIDELQTHLVYEAYLSLLKRADSDWNVEDWEMADKFERHAVNAALDIREYKRIITAQEQRLEKLQSDNAMISEANRGLDASRTNLINQIENAEDKIEAQAQRLVELETELEAANSAIRDLAEINHQIGARLEESK